MGKVCLVVSAFAAVMVAKFDEDHRACGDPLNDGSWFPLEVKSLTADVALNVVTRIGPFE